MPNIQKREGSLRLILNCLSFVFLCLCFSPSLAASQDYLIIENNEGKKIYSSPLRKDKGFAIRYQHSVALTPVIDYFLPLEGDILLTRTEYKDFGAGLPYMPEEGQSMRQENGLITISDINRKMPEFTLRVGRVANHELILFDENNMILPLNKLAEPGTSLTFKIKEHNF